MTNITVTVTGAQIRASLSGLLTGGMVGVPVEFTFDEDWTELVKTALFRAGDVVISIHELRDTVFAPWEVLKKANCTLYVGVCGTAQDGALVIPTLWAQVGMIQPGADVESTPAADPALPVWKEALDTARNAQSTALAVQGAAQAGEFNGYSPVRGLDYWTESDINEIRSYVDDAILGGAW